MKLHVLKIKEEYLYEILRGKKTFEIRKNDRNYQIGDLIHFVDTDGREYNYRYFYDDDDIRVHCIELVIYQITYILENASEYGLEDGYCILSIKRLKGEEV